MKKSSNERFILPSGGYQDFPNTCDAEGATKCLKSEYVNPAASIDDCRCAKLAELSSECERKINSGFESDVLGYPCHYHNDRDQQQTMRDAAVNGGKIWRNEEFTLHTKAQAEAVLSISLSEKELHRTTYANKCSYVNKAERTVDEINAVTWTSVE